METDSEAGFSLVEVIIAMLILALMSVGVLPLLLGAIQSSTGNRDLVIANQLANAELMALRAQFPDTADNSCGSVTTAASAEIETPEGSEVTVDLAVAACPVDTAEYPFAVTVTASVRATEDAAEAMTVVPTKILVTGP